VGISRISCNQLNIAGAIDQELLSQSTPGKIARSIFGEAGITLPKDFDDAVWRGTPALTSRPNQVSAERLFLIGDASGYVEPFTGEGMAAALETAVAVVPLAIRASANWVPALAPCWTAIHRKIVCDRQVTSRQFAWVLRRPWAARVAMVVCRTMPQLAAHLIARTTVPSNAFISPGLGTP
jgi:2-polyprenyl-6-methoxyphenol hydroxylase-like FAD-dependent oxidoreductase